MIETLKLGQCLKLLAKDWYSDKAETFAFWSLCELNFKNFQMINTTGKNKIENPLKKIK